MTELWALSNSHPSVVQVTPSSTPSQGRKRQGTIHHRDKVSSVTEVIPSCPYIPNIPNILNLFQPEFIKAGGAGTHILAQFSLFSLLYCGTKTVHINTLYLIFTVFANNIHMYFKYLNFAMFLCAKRF